MPIKSKSFSDSIQFINRFSCNLLRSKLRRKVVCLFLILSLFIWPGTSLALKPLSVFASTAIYLGTDASRDLSQLVKNLFWSKSAATRQETLADRLARVERIQVSPSVFVGYQNQPVVLAAIASDLAGSTVQGVKFSWESSDTDKVQIDDSGQAVFLQPGRAKIICRAGSVKSIVPVLVKPGPRPMQTDAQWRIDQAGLNSDDAPTGASSAAFVHSLLDKVSPTAEAQIQPPDNSEFYYDQLWSEPRNLIGSPPNRATDSWRLGKILPEGSNYSLAILIYSFGGRGFSSDLTLYYNSRIWSRRNDAGVEKVAWNAGAGWPSPGYSLGFGRIVVYGPSNNTKYVWVEPNGTRHYLGSGDASTTGTYETTDGTHITFVGSAANGGSLNFNDGTKVAITVTNNRLLPTQIRDRNGNYITISYQSAKGGVPYAPTAINFVTDTLGRAVSFNYTFNVLTSITLPSFNGGATNIVSFDYQNLTVSYNFSGLTVENAPTGTQKMLKHVYFAQKQTGYMMSYSDYGMAYNVSLRKQMSVDQQGVISDGTEMASANFNYPTSGSTQLTDAPGFSQRVENPGGTFTYSVTEDVPNQTRKFKTARPDTSELWLVRSTDSASTANGMLTESFIKNSTGATLSRSVYGYTTDAGGSKQVQSVTSYNDANQPTKVNFDYDGYGNITNKREYGFQIGGQWKARRRTRTVYKTDAAYTSIYMRSLVTESNIYDALENTTDADDVMISKITFTHDDYTSPNTLEDYSGAANPPGHMYGVNYTTRGNVTQTKRYKDILANQFITTTTRYDIFGNAVKAEASCCDQVTQTFTEPNYWSVTITMTKGSDPNQQVTTSATYDFNTSLQKTKTLPGNLTTNYSYDGVGRPTQISPPEDGSVTVNYDPALLKTTTTVNFTENGIPKSFSESATVNGWGETVITVNRVGGQVNTGYDAMGRVASATNPFQAGGSPGPSTNYTYDALGRMTITTLPDNNTRRTEYSGATVTAFDEVSRKTKQEIDGLGRSIKVTEQDNDGVLVQDTVYTYNLLDKLTVVDQGNQRRNYKYDDLSRMLYEKIPEQTATINDGTGTLWTTQYTYNDSDLVATRKDARGVITTYTYDTLNRLTNISYDVSQASGVASTGSVAYNYDNQQGSATKGQLLNVTITSGQTTLFRESYGYDSINRLASRSRSFEGNYTTSYQYNGINQVTRLTYPSTRAVNYSHANGSALLESVVNNADGKVYVNGFGYNYAEQMTGQSFGDGTLNLSYGYDAQRLQLTSQSAVRPSIGTLMSLTYNYQSQAHQQGKNTTAGNTGQLMSVSGSINNLTESATYRYDLQRRVVSSNQTTNGASAQRRFEYDRWGNRTAVWDAVSGGNQIQTVTIAQTNSVANNRIASVWAGFNVNYNYDAAGNVTWDGAHSYTYDAENRLVSVDGGGTATYTYDHQNRRVKSVTGTASIHYVWENSQVLAEHNVSNGSLRVEYINSDGKVVAKEEAGAAETYYFLSDLLSIRAVLGYSAVGGWQWRGRQGHLPFGENLAVSGSADKHRFTTYERNAETDTDYAVNRQYAQGVGRFMRVDPMRECQKNDPQSLNRYAYAQNDPINFTDSVGLDREPVSRYSVVCNYSLRIEYSETPGGIIIVHSVTLISRCALIRSQLELISQASRIIARWRQANTCEKKTALRFPLAAFEVADLRDQADAWFGQQPEEQRQDNTWANAVQHCYFSCLATIHLSFEIAEAFGNAHECGEGTEGSRHDLHNNSVGRTIGYNLGFSGTDAKCLEGCMHSDQLRWVNGNPLPQAR